MSDTMTIVLACPSCEAEWEVAPHQESVACFDCGSQQLVRLYGTNGFQEAPSTVQAEEIERLQQAKNRRMAELARQQQHAEILHAQHEIASWQQTPLDEISPPTLAEKSLPVVAGAALLFGCLADTRRSRTKFDMLLAGSLLLGLYAFMRGQRRGRAQQRVQNVVGRWQADLEGQKQQAAKRGA